jgi:hypothetical protein
MGNIILYLHALLENLPMIVFQAASPNVNAMCERHIHMAMCLIHREIHISLWAKHRHKEKTRRPQLNIQVEPTSFLNQSLCHVYDGFAHDEDLHLHCLEPTQHSWVLDLT